MNRFLAISSAALYNYTMPIRSSLSLISLFIASQAVAELPLSLDVVEHRLPNGLTLLMLEHHQAPVVSCSLFYRVGSANEDVGMTGISHLLEHMMFKGTRTIGTKDFSREEPLLEKIDRLNRRIGELEKLPPEKRGADIANLREELAAAERAGNALMVKNELWKLYMQYGATGLNAATGRDRTCYMCSLPANRLELWMWLESDRMQNAVFREFYRERSVVIEERRLSVDDSPEGTFDEQLFATAFIAHPYRWPIIGWKSDIPNISPQMLTAYYRRYYAPNNAIAVVVGDIRPQDVIALAKNYFGPIPSQPPPPPVVTREPAQRGMRQVTLKLPAAPRLAFAFHTPAVNHDDTVALDLLERILTGGRTSRLYKRLVDEKKIAVSVSAYNITLKYPSLFIIQAVPRRPRSNDDVERALAGEIAALSREPVSAWELQKAKNEVEADFVRELESTGALSSLIGTYEAIDSWEYLNRYIPKVRAVTPRDLLRVVRTYVNAQNCSKVEIQKKE